MSKKYYDKILTSSGTSSVKVKSAFGAKILAKYGWTDGKGLGANEDGVAECVQVEKREDRVGIGAEKRQESEWNDWWSGAYDQAAKSISAKVGGGSKRLSSVISSDSDESESERVARAKREKKAKKIRRQRQEEEPVVKEFQKRRVKRQVRDE